jgi:hypothetical protein
MHTLRSKLKVACVAACVSLVMVSSAAQAKLCASPTLEPALHARMLQTELMVAALYCGSSSQYNAFVQRYGAQLVVSGSLIKEAFEQEHGKGYKRPWDTWLTKLANNASLRSMESIAAYCGETNLIFETLNGPGVDDVREYAGLRPFADKHGLKSCPRDTQTAQRNAEITGKNGKGS